jgi:hypothetical protein
VTGPNGQAAHAEAPCLDCGTETLSNEPGVPTEYYTVHDAVWADAGMGDGCLCIGCLESRLGRRLHRADFTSAPVNDLMTSNTRYCWSWRSARLIDRLTSPDQVQGVLFGEQP